MKLRNKIAAITAAAMLAFTGVGFAAWAFTKTESASVEHITGKVTAAIEASGLRVTDGTNDITGLYLICDAPSGQAGLVAGDGIYWATDDQGTNPISSLTLIGSVTEDDNDIADISTYVGTFKSTATSAVTGNWVNIAATTALDQDVTSASKDADVQYVWTLPAVEYVAVPTSVTEVNALETEVNALDLTFAFTFNVKSVA